MNPFRFIASAFGIGYLPVLPGTFGSLFGLGLHLLYFNRLGKASLPWILALSVVGLFASHKALEGQKEKDPSWIVVDEVLGMLVSLYAIPLRWPLLLLGFCLFRFFDIVKPFPTNRFESLPGAWGILLDDLGAGVYVNIVLQIFLRVTS